MQIPKQIEFNLELSQHEIDVSRSKMEMVNVFQQFLKRKQKNVREELEKYNASYLLILQKKVLAIQKKDEQIINFSKQIWQLKNKLQQSRVARQNALQERKQFEAKMMVIEKQKQQFQSTFKAKSAFIQQNIKQLQQLRKINKQLNQDKLNLYAQIQTITTTIKKMQVQNNDSKNLFIKKEQEQLVRNKDYIKSIQEKLKQQEIQKQQLKTQNAVMKEQIDDLNMAINRMKKNAMQGKKEYKDHFNKQTQTKNIILAHNAVNTQIEQTNKRSTEKPTQKLNQQKKQLKIIKQPNKPGKNIQEQNQKLISINVYVQAYKDFRQVISGLQKKIDLMDHRYKELEQLYLQRPARSCDREAIDCLKRDYVALELDCLHHLQYIQNLQDINRILSSNNAISFNNSTSIMNSSFLNRSNEFSCLQGSNYINHTPCQKRSSMKSPQLVPDTSRSQAIDSKPRIGKQSGKCKIQFQTQLKFPLKMQQQSQIILRPSLVKNYTKYSKMSRQRERAKGKNYSC